MTLMRMHKHQSTYEVRRIFGASDTVREGEKFEILDFESYWKTCVAETKVLIICAVTAQLMSAFVFA